MAAGNETDGAGRERPPLSEDSNPFLDNPYQATQLQGNELWGAQREQSAQRMVGHVRAVAVLMIVQGVLELVMALGLGAMTGFVVLDVQRLTDAPAGPDAPPGADSALWIMSVVYGLLVLAVLVAGVLHILAGIRNYHLRGRVFGIVALIVGMVTTLATCYCAPTAIALTIYGLICYLHPDGRNAFAREAAK